MPVGMWGYRLVNRGSQGPTLQTWQTTHAEPRGVVGKELGNRYDHPWPPAHSERSRGSWEGGFEQRCRHSVHPAWAEGGRGRLCPRNGTRAALSLHGRGRQGTSWKPWRRCLGPCAPGLLGSLLGVRSGRRHTVMALLLFCGQVLLFVFCLFLFLLFLMLIKIKSFSSQKKLNYPKYFFKIPQESAPRRCC